MGIPDFQSFFKPLLDIAEDGNEHSLRESRDLIANGMKLSPEDLSERLPSGIQTKFENRVAWAKSYFVQAKVLAATRRAHFRITDRGRELLRQGHERIDVSVLNQYPEFVEFHHPQTSGGNGESAGDGLSRTTHWSASQILFQSAQISLQTELNGRQIPQTRFLLIRVVSFALPTAGEPGRPLPQACLEIHCPGS